MTISKSSKKLPLPQKLTNYDALNLQFLGFPCAYPAGVMSPLWAVILGSIPLRPPGHIILPRHWKKGYLLLGQLFILSCHIGTLPATKFHLWTSLGKMRAIALMNPAPSRGHTPSAPSDPHDALPPKVREKHSPLPPWEDGTRVPWHSNNSKCLTDKQRGNMKWGVWAVFINY